MKRGVAIGQGSWSGNLIYTRDERVRPYLGDVMLKQLKFWLVGVLVGVGWFLGFSMFSMGLDAQKNDPGALWQLAMFVVASVISQAVLHHAMRLQTKRAFLLGGIVFTVLAGGLFGAFFLVQTMIERGVGNLQTRDLASIVGLGGGFGFVMGMITSVMFGFITFPVGFAGVWAMRKALETDAPGLEPND
jgi:hypothetical protein